MEFNLLIVTLIFVVCISNAVAISTPELDAALSVLRAQGHGLFANAVSTSDLLFDVISLENLTLLAPTDPTVFALDMTNAPSLYVSTLRLHVLPVRLSWSEIRLLSNGSLLPTLSLVRQLRVVRYQEGRNLLAVDGDGGVEVVMPGLYYSPNVAVHALGGILTFRSKIPISNSSVTISLPPTTNPSNGDSSGSSNRVISFPPSPLRVPVSNDTVLPSPTPSTITAVFNDTSNNHTLSPRCLPVNHARPVYPPSPSPSLQSFPVYPPSPSLSHVYPPSPSLSHVYPPSPESWLTPSQSPSPFLALAPENERKKVVASSMCVVE